MPTVTSAEAVAQASNMHINTPAPNARLADMVNQFTTGLGNVNLGNTNDNLTPLLKNIGNNLGVDLFNMKESDINKIATENSVNFDINGLSNGANNNYSLNQMAKIVSDIDSLDLEKMRAEIKAAGGDPTTTKTSITRHIIHNSVA
jgi:hypothetical protein